MKIANSKILLFSEQSGLAELENGHLVSWEFGGKLLQLLLRQIVMAKKCEGAKSVENVQKLTKIVKN